MLGTAVVRRQLQKLGKQRPSNPAALAGLRRLAFGRINDALALLRDDAGEISPETLDLFNVSEIKRAKGGGVEIKFFDRLEALERLSELEDRADNAANADGFFTALQKGMELVGKEDN